MARAVSAAPTGPLSRPAPARTPGGQVTARNRNRPPRPAAGGGRARGGPSSAGILRFYTPDEAPGLRIGPTVVLVSSLLFIGSVVLLHIWGKFSSRT